jgi:trehalose 6-phosphate phosphatase
VRDVLGPDGQRMLRSLDSVVLGFDFDGTLAPIVPHRERAGMALRTAGLFSEVVKRYPVVVISGRARDDVRERLGGIPVLEVVGNHGLEGLVAPERSDVLRGWSEALRARLARVQGVDVEDKKFTLAVHYRAAEDPTEAEAQIRRAVAELGTEAELVGGKRVLNVVPRGAPNKGTALLDLRGSLGKDQALFVGDDVTDEDVFALPDPGVVGVRVGFSPHTAAEWFVPSQRSVNQLLEQLIAARR